MPSVRHSPIGDSCLPAAYKHLRLSISSLSLCANLEVSAPTMANRHRRSNRVSVSSSQPTATDRQRRSARQPAGIKRPRYHDPDTDDEYDYDESEGEQDYEPEPALGPSRTQRRSSRKKVKITQAPKPQAQRPAKRVDSFYKSRKAVGRSRPKKTHPFNKRAFDVLPPTPRKKDLSKDFKGPSDGRVPDWTSLPIDILRDIFVFAANPIHEQTPTASANVTWLMRSALTCRAFAIPALEAYYLSPSLLSNVQPHHFYELLQIPKDETYIDYCVKVKSLEIDVRRITYTVPSKPSFSLGDVVARLPQLQHLEIIHPVDTPPYRPMKVKPWSYPPLEYLVGCLEQGDVRLKSWRWNRNMIPAFSWNVENLRNLYGSMTRCHESIAFKYLRRLVVCGYDVDDSAEPQPSAPAEDGSIQRPPTLTSSISKLSYLKDLTFISCDLIEGDFLNRLPKNLERLELSNCLEVTSAMLKAYLTTGGSQLRELVLNHNAAVDLSILLDLKTLCPQLEVLKMDFTYYSERTNYNDAWAMYDHLLKEDEVPTWPSKMRHLGLVNMQKWGSEAAQNLFRSLVDNAEELSDLRILILHAHINMAWRDRAGFRDQWIDRLNRVYLRKAANPNPHLGSLRQFKLWKELQPKGRAPVRQVDGEGSENEHIVQRRLSHVRVTPRKRPADVEMFSDSDPPHNTTRSTRPRRSTRVAESQSQSATYSDSEESDDDSGDDWRTQPEAFIQGLCEVVDIRIDNQRPREKQYTEANFLDSEPSGDEDWHSGAELDDDGDRYAW